MGTCRLRGVGFKTAILQPPVPTTSSVGAYVRVNSHLVYGKIVNDVRTTTEERSKISYPETQYIFLL